MRELKIKKEEIGQQLWPISFEGTLIFNDAFLGKEGFFGVHDNHLNFIPQANVPDNLKIYIPENLDEVQGFLSSAEYILQRVMMTPNIEVIGFDNSDLSTTTIHRGVITIFSDFIDNYAKNSSDYERHRNRWNE